MENDANYNPDVLNCLANLSNDEVFTSPEVANRMLDMLPQELFRNPNAKFLDPATKSGVFLREIAKRLIVGLKPVYPNLQARLDHIFHEQLYGIAITELTSLISRRSLYCSKYPNGKYSISKFDNATGNVRYKRTEHVWKDGRCSLCGASQRSYDRDELLETHAYEFIHTTNPEEIFNMKFDVIIGNPPYQLNDGGNKASASPIYHMFIEQAQKLQPRYLAMIIPSRWYSGGKGLDEFRSHMLNDRHVRVLVDFTDSADCFPGVDIAGGVCYFLWDRDNPGVCTYTNNLNGKSTTVEKELNEYSTFIRYPVADGIIKKVKLHNEKTMDSMVSTRKPFGLATNVEPTLNGELTLRYNQGCGKFPRKSVQVGVDMIDKWKVMISYLSAEHAGQPDKSGKFRVLSTMEILPPKSICTETYLIAGAFENESSANNLLSYLKTKFVRFLVAQIAVSQHITKNCFSFVPIPNLSHSWTDEELYANYNLSDEEIAFIESMIKPMDSKDNE